MAEFYWIRASIPPIGFMPVIVDYKTKRNRSIFQIAVHDGNGWIFPNSRQPLIPSRVKRWARVPIE